MTIRRGFTEKYLNYKYRDFRVETTGKKEIILELAPADAVTLPFTPVLHTKFRMIVMLISMLDHPSNVLFFLQEGTVEAEERVLRDLEESRDQKV